VSANHCSQSRSTYSECTPDASALGIFSIKGRRPLRFINGVSGCTKCDVFTSTSNTAGACSLTALWPTHSKPTTDCTVKSFRLHGGCAVVSKCPHCPNMSQFCLEWCILIPFHTTRSGIITGPDPLTPNGKTVTMLFFGTKIPTTKQEIMLHAMSLNLPVLLTA